MNYNAQEFKDGCLHFCESVGAGLDRTELEWNRFWDEPGHERGILAGLFTKLL